MGGLLQQHGGADRRRQVVAHGDDAVVDEQERPRVAEALRDVDAHVAGDDEVGRAGVVRHLRRHEERARVGHRLQLAARSAERDGVRRVRVHDGSDVGPREHDLAVDRPLDVARALAVQDLAVPADEQDVLLGHLLEPQARALHPDAAAVGVAHRRVPPDVVVVPVAVEHAAGQDDLPPDLRCVGHESSGTLTVLTCVNDRTSQRSSSRPTSEFLNPPNGTPR